MALFGLPGAEGVQCRQFRAFQAHGAIDILRALDARVALVAGRFRRWRRQYHLPGSRMAVGGVLRQQRVQECGAGARQAENKGRLGDHFGADGRPPLAVVDELQARFGQCAQAH